MRHRNSNPKERIMETATKLFHRQGYQATGINQVVQEAEVARASLYQHYESKEKLCMAFLKRRHIYWFDRLKEFTDRVEGSKQKVLAAFDFLYSMNEKEDYSGCAFLNILSEITVKDREILAIIQDHKRDLRKYLADLISGTPVPGIPVRGTPKPQRIPDTVKDHVYLLFESAIIESRLFRQQWPVTEAKKIVDHILK
jgi:AcrR family transcriptional regulator